MIKVVRVTEKAAGTESIANRISDSSRASIETNKGVALRAPLCLTKNFLEFESLETGNLSESQKTTGLSLVSAGSSLNA